MNAESFCYWLQGFLEVSQTTKVDEKQVQIIKDHLNLVFNKKTPDYQMTINPNQKVKDLFKSQPYCSTGGTAGTESIC